MASLNAMSGEVLVSLTPPVGGETVTGYRIYYNSGGSQTSEVLTTTANDLVLDLKGAILDDMMISIRAESDQLPSELVSVNVVAEATTTMEVPSTTTAEADTTTEPATTTESPTTTESATTTEPATTTDPPTTTESATTTEPAATTEPATTTEPPVTTIITVVTTGPPIEGKQVFNAPLCV